MLKNLRNVFVVDETNNENDEKPSNKETSTPKSKNQPKETVPDAKSTVTPKEGVKDSKIINTLFKAIEKSNLDGFDYLEFKQSIKGLEKMVIDEATRYKSAFATASTMGVTLDKLVDTANYYIKVLDKEKSQFFKAAGEQTTSLVDNRKKEIQLLLKTMADKKEMISRMQGELDKSEQRLKIIQNGIDQASVKIENTKKNFDVSFSHLRDQITTDIDKIKNYLK